MKIFSLSKSKYMKLLFITGLCAVAVRLILDSRFATSSFLYLAVPFLIAVVLYNFVGYGENESAWDGFWGKFWDATIIMLASSFILFEGFICVLMFMPIYYLGLLMGLVFSKWFGRKSIRNNKLQVFLLPVVVLILGSEGIFAITTVPRDNQVTHTRIVEASIADLKANMAKPIAFEQRRNWFLSIFPLPTEVKAGSLTAGDIHTLNFVYKRWFFTNIQQGEMRLLIAEVGDDFVRTKVVGNSSYLANYLTIEGTEVMFKAVDPKTTEVSLTLFYERKLDPSWYFGPLQRVTLQQSAKYLVDTVIRREFSDG